MCSWKNGICVHGAAGFTPPTWLTLNVVSTTSSAASVVSLGPCQPEMWNIERMHSQRCSVITALSQQVSSRLHCERKSPPSEITDFHCRRGSATKMTLILTQTWKRMLSGTHMPAVKIGIPEVADCLHYIVFSVCMQYGVFVCVCKQHLSHSFHSSDSSACLCLQIADRGPLPLVFLHLEMKLKECWSLACFYSWKIDVKRKHLSQSRRKLS